jgi:hypothetical protein
MHFGLKWSSGNSSGNFKQYFFNLIRFTHRDHLVQPYLYKTMKRRSQTIRVGSQCMEVQAPRIKALWHSEKALHYFELRYAACRVLFNVKLSINILNVVMLSVDMITVVEPHYSTPIQFHRQLLQTAYDNFPCLCTTLTGRV